MSRALRHRYLQLVKFQCKITGAHNVTIFTGLLAKIQLGDSN